jgi:3-oxoacyl-[acyl-carrier protein] reductase
VISLTQTVAVDVAGANIFVNAIAPGGVRTDQFDAYLSRLDPDATNALYQMIPAGRLGEGHEYGALAVHLASDETYCVGQVISPNGGLVI